MQFQFATSRIREWSPNVIRGQVGAALMRQEPAAYERYFAPRRAAGSGPSGFADPPRPFVLRPSGESRIAVNVFDPEAEAPIARVVAGLGELACAPVETRVMVPLVPSRHPVCRVRVHFLTPTELKGAETPEFVVLLSRIRDRVSTLRALYGAGPLTLDFRAFGECAAQVRMTRCELSGVEDSRVSKNTGQQHPLSGFTGVAEYEGDLAEFIPYLEAAKWTGVGRQTVWGKGEISFEEI